MISVELARKLREAGLRWDPEPGDRFVIPNRGMDDDVFVVSQMVVDVHDFPTGRVLGFNGTVEWALDSVEQDVALWLPGESRLRELLGGTFVGLNRVEGGYRVTLEVSGHRIDIEDELAEEAYGKALLYLATG
ncbi:pilus assembly protein CpaE [Jiangella asiatica]|uniref:Pilus assembly protein CpaE n=1 Tax=Jiangella asiatica TaxID=2530372 RepID=A0A4R5DCB6_9ACTN|nr:pilus assembly protein CpaE [Jiangella asiatica]TDE07913.1 pilus assembly protein CpaE [Jiangella asiatica]